MVCGRRLVRSAVLAASPRLTRIIPSLKPLEAEIRGKALLARDPDVVEASETRTRRALAR